MLGDGLVQSFVYRVYRKGLSLFLHHCNGLFLHHCSGLSWGGSEVRSRGEAQAPPLLWWGRWRSGAGGGGGVTRDGVRTVPLSFKFSNWQ